MELNDYFKNIPKAALAFSGGTDSVYLLYAAVKNGVDITPYFVKTPFQPQFELEDAKRAAAEIGVCLKVIQADHLSEKSIFENSDNRCYHCKKFIFKTIKKQAEIDGYTILLDGTNASDNADERPGMKAISELLVQSPLAKCGLDKEKIRELSHEAGLFTWNKPAYACLATRIPTGEKITYELLKKIEISEKILFDMGFSDCRVRIFHGAAKLQFKNEQFDKAVSLRDKITKEIEKYFPEVFLDLKGR